MLLVERVEIHGNVHITSEHFKLLTKKSFLSYVLKIFRSPIFLLEPNISYPLISYHRIRNVTFSENVANVPNE